MLTHSLLWRRIVADLCIRLWLTFAFHLPFFSRLNYLKYVMGFENAALVSTASASVAQISSFYSLRWVTRIIQRRGKLRTLVYICCCACAVSTTFALIPPATFKALGLYFVQPVVEGFTQVALYTIPEWLLADVIDYDELRSGQRREGIFVVFDVSLTSSPDLDHSITLTIDLITCDAAACAGQHHAADGHLCGGHTWPRARCGGLQRQLGVHVRMRRQVPCVVSSLVVPVGHWIRMHLRPV